MPLLDQLQSVLSPQPQSSAACLVVNSSGTIAAGPAAVPFPPGATWAMPLGVVVVRPPASGAVGVDVVGVLGVGIGHPLPMFGRLASIAAGETQFDIEPPVKLSPGRPFQVSVTRPPGCDDDCHQSSRAIVGTFVAHVPLSKMGIETLSTHYRARSVSTRTTNLCRLAELPRFCSGKMSTTWKEEGVLSSK
jgi:hypothetical protein